MMILLPMASYWPSTTAHTSKAVMFLEWKPHKEQIAVIVRASRMILITRNTVVLKMKLRTASRKILYSVQQIDFAVLSMRFMT